MWRTIAKALLLVIGALAELIRRRKLNKQLEEVQREQDHINNDPAGWIIDHFDGLPVDDATDSADPLPDEAEDRD